MSMKLMVQVWEHDFENSTRTLIMLKLADNADDNGRCFPSIKHIADKCKCSQRTVINHIHWLEEKGFLTVRRTKKANSKENAVNIYQLNLGGEIDSLGGEIDSLGVVKQLHSNQSLINQSNNTYLYDGIGQNDKKRKSARFVPPTIDECFLYCQSKIEAEKFWHYYESNGWKVGKNKMKNWKSALTGWMKRAESYNQPKEGERKWSDLNEEEQLDLMMNTGIQLDDETKRYYGMI